MKKRFNFYPKVQKDLYEVECVICKQEFKSTSENRTVCFKCYDKAETETCEDCGKQFKVVNSNRMNTCWKCSDDPTKFRFKK